MDKMAGETSLHIWDIHVDETHQRKGLGKHLLTLMELIARRYISNTTITMILMLMQCYSIAVMTCRYSYKIDKNNFILEQLQLSIL